MTLAKTELTMTASASLQEEVSKELEIEDPKLETAEGKDKFKELLNENS
jgi:hypothetical protein